MTLRPPDCNDSDPDPLRDRLRATWGRPAAEIRDDLRRVAEANPTAPEAARKAPEAEAKRKEADGVYQRRMYYSRLVPGWKPMADHEPDRAIATRKALLDRLAAGKTRVIGYHLPYPGTGYVERKDGAYRFVAG